MIRFCLALVLLLSAWGKELTYVPGWNGALPSRMYTGYLDASSPQHHYFHWFVESENDPTTDPLILWVQGGPGASSVADGFFQEHGPFRMDDMWDGKTGLPTLSLRPYRWTTNASVIYWESPPGVGYSYCDDNKCPEWTDETAAENNYDFLCSFFQAYPQYQDRDFYVTGESYGGIYVPTLSYQILKGTKCKINLKGLAIGNGCWGNADGTACGRDKPRYTLRVLRDHIMITEQLYDAATKECYNAKLGRVTFFNPSKACEDAVVAASTAAGQFARLNVYDTCPGAQTGDDLTLLFQICWSGHAWACNKLSASEQQQMKELEAIGRGPRWTPDMLGEPLGSISLPRNYGAEGTLRCVHGLSPKYLKLPEVQAALGANVVWGSQTFLYKRTLNTTIPIMNQLIDNYHVWIYNGDADACVPYPSAFELFEKELHYPVESSWKPWLLHEPVKYTSKPAVAGYITEYVSKHGLTFVTIKDSGHLVPHWSPLAAWQMIQAVSHNTTLV